jgi:serine protease Do
VKRVLNVFFMAWVLTVVSLPVQARVTGLPDFTELMDKAGPAVVNIRVTQYGNRAGRAERDQRDEQPRYHDDEDMPEFFRRFFGEPNDPRFGRPDRVGAGSGFIIEPDGYIITNHHVIEDADQIIVRLADRREYEAELIGSDELSDIALIKIDETNLPTLKLGDSDKLKPGEWVAAIGSPFNFEQSITAGIVSAKGRSNAAQQYVPFIQSDVAINRGNSGGPLLNMDGEVVGINSWILSSSGGYIGLSFSIPIEVAESSVKQLRESGSVQRGLLGVVVGAVTRELAEALGLERPVGAMVNDVTPDGAADRAGIKPGDVILAFNGTELETWNELPPLVGSNPPGTKAEVLVSRDGETRTFDVVLDALPNENAAAGGEGGGARSSSNLLGLDVESISAEQRRQMGDPEGGVVVANVDSDEAWRAGVRPGDVILMINNQVIEGMDDFDDAIEDLEAGKAVALRVWRDGNTSFIAYTPREAESD